MGARGTSLAPAGPLKLDPSPHPSPRQLADMLEATLILLILLAGECPPPPPSPLSGGPAPHVCLSRASPLGR